MGFSRWEYWSGLPCPSPGGLPDPEKTHSEMPHKLSTSKHQCIIDSPNLLSPPAVSPQSHSPARSNSARDPLIRRSILRHSYSSLAKSWVFCLLDVFPVIMSSFLTDWFRKSRLPLLFGPHGPHAMVRSSHIPTLKSENSTFPQSCKINGPLPPKFSYILSCLFVDLSFFNPKTTSLAHTSLSHLAWVSKALLLCSRWSCLPPPDPSSAGCPSLCKALNSASVS